MPFGTAGTQGVAVAVQHACEEEGLLVSSVEDSTDSGESARLVRRQTEALRWADADKLELGLSSEMETDMRSASSQAAGGLSSGMSSG